MSLGSVADAGGSSAGGRSAGAKRQGIKGKPRGAVFIQLYVARGQGKGQPLSAARQVGLFTKNPIEVQYAEAENGKQAVYWARWISPTSQAGQWSSPTTMMMAA